MILLTYSTFQTTFLNRTLAVLKKKVKLKVVKRTQDSFLGVQLQPTGHHCYQPQKSGVITLGERNICNTEKFLLCYGNKEIIISP